MKHEAFLIFKSDLINKDDMDDITLPGDDYKLTAAQIKELIDDKILPPLIQDKDRNKDGTQDWTWFHIYEMDLMPDNICYSCLVINQSSHGEWGITHCNSLEECSSAKPETYYCDHCYKWFCNKCMPMIQTRYCDEEFTEMMCIKCLSSAIQANGQFLSDRGWFLNISELAKNYHIIPRRMDSTKQKKIIDGAIEMQARPSGSLFAMAKDEFDSYKDSE